MNNKKLIFFSLKRELLIMILKIYLTNSLKASSYPAHLDNLAEHLKSFPDFRRSVPKWLVLILQREYHIFLSAYDWHNE